MYLNKKISLLRKLRIKYEYHWLNEHFPLEKVVAPVTWLLTHNEEQINSRVAKFTAEREAEMREWREGMRELRDLTEKIIREMDSNNF